MSIIYQTNNFTVEAHQRPHVDRNDGGHVVIRPKERITDRQDLTPEQAIELMRLTIVAGEAMAKVMNERGVDIGRINYQDNGNWSVFNPEGPHFHMHLYGRAKSAKVHKYGQACYFPHIDDQPEYYENFKPLTKEDVEEIGREMEKIFADDKFSDEKWFGVDY
ncbi:MAG: HIT domain-containing protein [Patescibacteria group bacterium]|nr:HIT domain-containing protein [Patescibacteria group bacterium]